jgi:cell wall-associated NlpC family hydrolase
VAAPEARAAQAERWGDVATWLARRGERRRPAEVNAAAAAVAMEQRGTPYAYGGGGPGGFDCSGLASYAFARAGKALPHNTNAIWGTLPKVPRGALRPGDMVFFSGLGHMGIYVGDGRFVHAPRTGEVVRVETLADRDDYVGAVRA